MLPDGSGHRGSVEVSEGAVGQVPPDPIESDSGDDSDRIVVNFGDQPTPQPQPLTPHQVTKNGAFDCGSHPPCQFVARRIHVCMYAI
jgi:hypothetical protein